MLDRRKQPRFRASLSLSLLELSLDEGGRRCIVCDLSQAGFRLETAEAMEAGRKFYFDLHLPGLGCVSGAALCRWVRIQGGPIRVCGTEIISLDPIEAARLGHHIRSLARRPMERARAPSYAFR